MRSGRLGISRIFRSDPLGSSANHKVIKIFVLGDLSFLQINDINILFIVFPDLELLPLV